MRIDRLRKNFEIAVQWTAFPLHPETPQEGRPLEVLFGASRQEVSAKMARLKHVADELGLPLGERTHTYNTRLAQELAKWAEAQGRGDEFHEAVFRAYFVHGRNIALIEELTSLATSVGLPGDEAEDILCSRTYRDAVDADWLRSRRLGITAVPTFIIGQQAVVGAQAYNVLERFLRANHVEERHKLRAPDS